MESLVSCRTAGRRIRELSHIVRASTSSSSESSGLNGLRVSNYDRVLSMVLAAVILVGLAVMILLALWLTSRLFLGQAAVPVVLEQVGSNDSPLSDQRDLETPDVDPTDLAGVRLARRRFGVALPPPFSVRFSRPLPER